MSGGGGMVALARIDGLWRDISRFQSPWMFRVYGRGCRKGLSRICRVLPGIVSDFFRDRGAFVHALTIRAKAPRS